MKTVMTASFYYSKKPTMKNLFFLNAHIIYAGQYNLDWIDWERDLLQRIVDTGLKSYFMTFVYMYRAGLRYLVRPCWSLVVVMYDCLQGIVPIQVRTVNTLNLRGHTRSP